MVCIFFFLVFGFLFGFFFTIHLCFSLAVLLIYPVIIYKPGTRTAEVVFK